MLRLIFAAALLCAAVLTARADLYALVDHAALSAGVPADIARAVIGKESGFNPNLRGAAGEWGLGQIKCSTAREVGLTGSCAQLSQPATNLRFAMAYLRLAIDKGGANCAGVALYQTGLNRRPSCSSYGRDVMRRARR